MGSVEGSGLGNAVGRLLGWTVGAGIGASVVGKTVGLLVGCNVGTALAGRPWPGTELLRRVAQQGDIGSQCQVLAGEALRDGLARRVETHLVAADAQGAERVQDHSDVDDLLQQRARRRREHTQHARARAPRTHTRTLTPACWGAVLNA